MNMHSHAAIRALQRCIPSVIGQWLDQFGEEKHDRHGCVLLFFAPARIRARKRAFECALLRQLSQYLDAYKFKSSHVGT